MKPTRRVFMKQCAAGCLACAAGVSADAADSTSAGSLQPNVLKPEIAEFGKPLLCCSRAVNWG
ncbi:MAG: twin-arginine translocation signal domain-containing protein [candidate division KSB1 bacterium]|nr:twin-arginine translocation signal domain-containing protein [candidate division KSB1 bacterium]